MKWFKAGVIGAIGSLIMFVLMMVAIHGAGVAPFNLAPSAAFMKTLGLPAKPLALIAHFGYGIVWSIVFVALFEHRLTIARGLGLAGVLWLGMMVIYSPIIGWGVFGFGDTATGELALGNPVKYVVATAVLHAIYGLTIGWGNARWLGRPAGEAGGQVATAGSA